MIAYRQMDADLVRPWAQAIFDQTGCPLRVLLAIYIKKLVPQA